MTAFKIGDKVKVTSNQWEDENGRSAKGVVLTVIADDKYTFKYINYDKNTVELYMVKHMASNFEAYVEDLETVTYKVGDRVRLIVDYDRQKKGQEGVVTSVFESSSKDANQMVYVDFGKDSVRGHPCGMYDTRLELIESQKPNVILQMIETTSKKVGTGDTQAILLSLMEEVGELATEINIENGTKKRFASVDGVEGEAIDVLIVVCDLLTSLYGSLDSELLKTRVAGKLAKWERNV